jgi:glutamate/tyrosine decarboxylase-like PLP-dependent enzyme
MPFPSSGVGRQALERLLEEARDADQDRRTPDWESRCFLFAVHASDELRAIGESTFTKFLRTDALSGQAFPSIERFQRDLVEWTTDLLNGSEEAVGIVTTGGTESIIVALKCAREWARANRPVDGIPEVLCSRPAHPAFDKAADLLGLRVVRVPEATDYRADLGAIEKAVSRDTIALVGSAPTYWHGVFDPIEELGELARERSLWLHVDACMGGYLAPFARKLGHPVPPFDLGVLGVRSIAADLHKYGFAPKGASVLLLHSPEEARGHAFDWHDRYIHYRTPGLSGTRSGAAIAAAWAVVRYLGEKGYLETTGAIFRARERILTGIRSMEELEVRGDPPLSLVSFGARALDTHAIGLELKQRGWLPNLFSGPPSIHLRLTPAHAPVADHFVCDLAASVKAVREGRAIGAGEAGLYAG